MKIVTNVVGPPAAGKSTFLSRLTTEHPELSHLSIDDFRREYKDETTAWYQLMKAIVATPMPLIESSGLSWRLGSYILDHPTLQKRGFVTVYLSGDKEVLHSRLTQRHRNMTKEAVPFQYELDEHSSIDYCLEHLDDAYPDARKVHTDKGSEEEIYREIKSYILMNYQ